MRKPVWIDCDPGVDDAAAIMLAHQVDEIELVGISTVAGNTTHDHTFDNGRKLVEFIGADVPVYPGASVPMVRPLKTAAYVHGNDGLAGVQIPDTTKPKETKKAWDALYEAVEKYGKDLEVLAVGPLTNLGIAMAKYPDLPEKLGRIIIMGGSASVGNATPAAEFNVYADPHAADRVFSCGVPVYMFGLDVTMKAYLTPEELEDLANMGSPQGAFVKDSFKLSMEISERLGLPGVAVHDACTVLYLHKPEMFTLKKAWVRVETHARITLGKTVTDLYSDAQEEDKHVMIGVDVDREEFAKTFRELMGKYA